MSMLQTIETPRDVVHRHLLQLIKEMHQTQLIEELLEPSLSSGKTKKKKNKKKEKANQIDN